MKTLKEQLEGLKNSAQKVVLTYFKDGELHFKDSDYQILFENGGWSHVGYIDEDDLYRLSAECVCVLADILIGNREA